LGDGYTESETELYRRDVESLQYGMFQQEPFKTYRNFFAVHRIEVPSLESGTNYDPYYSIGSENSELPPGERENPADLRDTAFDCGFWAGGAGNVRRVITCDTSKVIREGANIPGQNYYVVLVNSKNYGGAALIGLNTFVTSRNAKPTSPLGALPVDVFLHELGTDVEKAGAISHGAKSPQFGTAKFTLKNFYV
jgi:hypothetical protein